MDANEEQLQNEPEVTVFTDGSGDDDYIKEATATAPNKHRTAEDISFEETKADPKAKKDPYAASFIPEPDEPEPDEQAQQGISTEELALSFSDLIVEGMKVFNEVVLPMVYESQVMGDLDSDVVNSFKRKAARIKNTSSEQVTTIPEFTEAEEEAGDLYIQVREYAKAAPFTPEEETKLKSTLKAWFVHMNWHVELPPWVQVVIVLATIEGKRVMPVARKPLGKLFSRKKKAEPTTTTDKQTETAA